MSTLFTEVAHEKVLEGGREEGGREGGEGEEGGEGGGREGGREEGGRGREYYEKGIDNVMKVIL